MAASIHSTLLRSHALGRFDKLLAAVSQDPAMLVWLDAGAELRGLALGEHMLFAGPRLEDLAIGVLSGGPPGTGALRACRNCG